MPVIEFNKKDFENLLGFEVEESQLETYFIPAKGELEVYDKENDLVKVEISDSNRPDLWGVEGIVRELKAHLGLENSLLKYNFKKSDYSVNVSGLKGIRPKASYCVVKNVNITEDLLVSLINMQEKIAGTFGKKRKEIAIGIFDLDKINGKKLKYYGADKKTKFVPLGFTQALTLEKILTEHKKGLEFGDLLKDFDKFPLLVDEKNEVLSMPPIINSNNSGRVELDTKNLFVDITGFEQEKVDVALLIFALAFADRGAEVELVEINYLDENKKYLLDLNPLEMSFDKSKIYDYLGEKISDEQIVELLTRKNYFVEINENKLNLKYPKYRQDILHPVDVIEDLIIEYGYNILVPEKMNFYTPGKLLKETEFGNLVREICVGMQLQEIVTFTLTSKKKQYENLGAKSIHTVELANPMSESIAIFREHLLPEVIEFLTKNQHISYPQNIFEYGRTLRVENNKVIEENHLFVGLCANKISYTDIKQRLDAFLKNIGALNIKYTALDYPFCISKRSAKVTFELNNKTFEGVIGELSPKTLFNYGLNMPLACFEISLQRD
jgi:phenylalanyl-tRNA synthetase beta chain